MSCTSVLLHLLSLVNSKKCNSGGSIHLRLLMKRHASFYSTLSHWQSRFCKVAGSNTFQAVRHESINGWLQDILWVWRRIYMSNRLGTWIAGIVKFTKDSKRSNYLLSIA